MSQEYGLRQYRYGRMGADTAEGSSSEHIQRELRMVRAEVSKTQRWKLELELGESKVKVPPIFRCG